MVIAELIGHFSLSAPEDCLYLERDQNKHHNDRNHRCFGYYSSAQLGHTVFVLCFLFNKNHSGQDGPLNVPLGWYEGTIQTVEIMAIEMLISFTVTKAIHV